jgi:hypothetical protein
MSDDPAGEYTFFYGKKSENHELGTGFLWVRESYQQLKRMSQFYKYENMEKRSRF